MSKFAYVEKVDGSSLTFIVLETNKSYTVNRVDTPRYDELVKGVFGQSIDIDEAVKIAEGIKLAARKIQSGDYLGVQLIDGVLFFRGERVRNALGQRIADLINRDLPVDSWIRFAENVYRNPRPWVADELDLWLASSNLPITEDGHFLAYKKVTNELKDIYTGKFDNSPGRIVQMEETEVDTVRDNLCSTGLHFCSKDYLPNFGTGPGNRVVIVKINPEHVVSIPSDYDNTKGRTWRYEVIAEIESDYAQTKEWAPAIDSDTVTGKITKNEGYTRSQIRDQFFDIPGIGNWNGDSGWVGNILITRSDDTYKFTCPKGSNIYNVLSTNTAVRDTAYLGAFASYVHNGHIKVTFEARSNRDAVMKVFWMNQYNLDRGAFNRNLYSVTVDGGPKLDNVIDHIETLRGVNIDFDVTKLSDKKIVVTITRNGFSPNNSNWREAVALLYHLLVFHQSPVSARYSVMTYIDDENIAVTHLHPDDAYNFEEGKAVLLSRVAKPNPEPTIYTGRLGHLTLSEFNAGVEKHGSMANWAKHLNIAASTVRNWKTQFDGQ